MLTVSGLTSNVFDLTPLKAFRHPTDW